MGLVGTRSGPSRCARIRGVLLESHRQSFCVLLRVHHPWGHRGPCRVCVVVAHHTYQLHSTTCPPNVQVHSSSFRSRYQTAHILHLERILHWLKIKGFENFFEAST